MKRKRVLGGLCGIILAAWAGAAAAGPVVDVPICPAGGRPASVHATAEPAVPVYDFRHSAADLVRLAKNRSPAHSSVGLTAWHWHLDVRPSFRRLFDPVSRRSCVTLENVDLRFGFGRTVVYVVRDYPPASCAREAVLAHENGHVAIINRALADHRVAIVRAVADAAGRQHPTETAAPNAVQRQIAQRLFAAAEKAVSAMLAEAKAGNAAHDSPKSYARTRAQCEQW